MLKGFLRHFKTSVTMNDSFLNVDYSKYKWNLICLAPGLLLYILRWGWRKYCENSSGIKNKPIPGSGIQDLQRNHDRVWPQYLDAITTVVKRLLCVIDERDQNVSWPGELILHDWRLDGLAWYRLEPGGFPASLPIVNLKSLNYT